MDIKKDQENTESSQPKTTAVDTGRRIDVSGVNLRAGKTLRRRPHGERSRVERTEKKSVKEPKESTITQEESTTKQDEKAMTERARPVVVDKHQEIPERKIPLYVEPLEIDDSGDFASMLKESEEETETVSLKVGDKVTGKVVHIGKEHIFVALGSKVEAAIAASELSDKEGRPTVRLGQKITSYVVSTQDTVLLSSNVAQSGVDLAVLEEACNKKVPVEGKVTAVNKGGFDVQIGEKRAFCPIGQIDIRFVEDTSAFIGRSFNFLIERIEESGRNIVVSRRALLERERKEKALETIEGLEVNKKYEAVITRVADFGAFADIGGLEGLIPRSEISYGHLDRVSDVISSGDRVEVVVLNFELDEKNPQKSKLSFSLKKTKEDPYTLHWNKIKAGTTFEGKVVRIESFGAFIELFCGIDGLIHISELSENRVAHPKEILSVGDPVTVRVVSVDDEERRIALSLREAVVRKKDASVAISGKTERGQKAVGVVSRIERYGVFLELDTGVTALLPQSETGLPKFADLHRSFTIGESIPVVVIDVDAQNRVRVSSLARREMEERDSYLQFQNKENERGRSLGTLADILQKKK